MELKHLEVKEDNRGQLVEAFKFPNDGQVFYVIATPHSIRGNHYHKRKTETFLIVGGSAEVVVRDRATGDTMRAEVNDDNPMTITILPNFTHAIAAGKYGCLFLVWASEIYNDKDPDTFREEV